LQNHHSSTKRAAAPDLAIEYADKRWIADAQRPKITQIREPRMTLGYVLFAVVWGVIVALTDPPLMVGALLVVVPIVVIGLIVRRALDIVA
jgi:hypothetical protein